MTDPSWAMAKGWRSGKANLEETKKIADPQVPSILFMPHFYLGQIIARQQYDSSMDIPVLQETGSFHGHFHTNRNPCGITRLQLQEGQNSVF